MESEAAVMKPALARTPYDKFPRRSVSLTKRRQFAAGRRKIPLLNAVMLQLSMCNAPMSAGSAAEMPAFPVPPPLMVKPRMTTTSFCVVPEIVMPFPLVAVMPA